MDWVYYLLLIILGLLGLFINILGLPGLWVMVLGAVVYAWVTGWNYVGMGILGTLIGVALVAEVLEFFAGAAGAKKAGGGSRAMWGGVLGALLGGFFLSFLVPIPIVGTIVGVCLGAFLGAAIAELSGGKGTQHSVRVGVGAAKGRFMGIVSKSMMGVIMLGIVAIGGCPVGGKSKVAPVPAPIAPPVTTTPATAV